MTAVSAPVALVTGAGRGLGRAIAIHLARAGHAVLVTDLELALAQATADAIGPAATALAMDVRDAAAVDRVSAEAIERNGGVDVLVNNAGLMTQGSFGATSRAEWAELVDTNLTGVFNCVQSIAPSMATRGRGAIVNIASVSSVRGGGAVGNVWYGATKAAVVAMTAGLARELGPRGVRVNAISPGVVETDMTRNALSALGGRVLARFPLGRIAEADDVARMAVFLASDAASFVTGQTIAVDGGFLTS